MTPGYFPTTGRPFKHWTPPENPTTIVGNTPTQFNLLPYRRKNMSDSVPSTPAPSACPAGQPAEKFNMSRLIAYASGALALAIVAAAAGSAVTFAFTHRSETLAHLGDNVIAGIGM